MLSYLIFNLSNASSLKVLLYITSGRDAAEQWGMSSASTQAHAKIYNIKCSLRLPGERVA